MYLKSTLSNMTCSMKNDYAKVNKTTTPRNQAIGIERLRSWNDFVKSNLRLWKSSVQIQCMEWFLWWNPWLHKRLVCLTIFIAFSAIGLALNCRQLSKILCFTIVLQMLICITYRENCTSKENKRPTARRGETLVFGGEGAGRTDGEQEQLLG